MGIGAILSIAQAAVGFAAASQQAAAQNAAYEQNRLNAIAAANDKYASISRRAVQEKEAASQKLLEKRIQGVKQRAQGKQAAAEAGVTGLSVAALMQDFEAQALRGEAAIITNFENKQTYLADEMDATYHQTVARIYSVRPAAKPSPIGFILQGLGGIMGGMR